MVFDTSWQKDPTGRGAWTQKGGATPYYALTATGTPNVGSHWVRRERAALPKDQSDAFHSVNAAAQATQRLLNAATGSTLVVDGWIGKATDTAIRQYQANNGLRVDGQIGPKTMRALLLPTAVKHAAAKAVPLDYMSGLVAFESGWDPAAVGMNGWDHGLGQINLEVHTVTWEQAMDYEYALEWTANNLINGYNRWLSRCQKSGANPWHIAIANHNSPKLAMEWAETGKAPYVEGRVIQIDTYVARVLASA